MQGTISELDNLRASFGAAVLDEVNLSGRSKVLVAHLRKLWPNVPKTDRGKIHRLIEQFATKLGLWWRLCDRENWSLAARVEFFRDS